MDPRLHEAALNGNVATLHELLQEDPLLLHKLTLGALSETPLHIASLLGHISFTEEILKCGPGLARMSDERGSYPLHLALARGHVEIAKELLKVDPSLTQLRDKDGRIPLHLAALNGQVNMSKELLLIDPTSARAVSDRGETTLHLCVKHRQVEAAALVLEGDKELLNTKDQIGNTALHLATAKKQIQMLNLLLKEPNIDLNAKNAYDLTAFDVLVLTPSEIGDMDIVEMLLKAGCKRGKEPTALIESKNPGTWKTILGNVCDQWQKKDDDWLKDMHNTLMIVATIIATLTFQAGLNPPGGFWQESIRPPSPMPSPSIDKVDAGTAIHDYFDQTIFQIFMFFDMTGLVSSLTVVLTLISGFPVRNRLVTWILVIATRLAVSSVALAFTFGTLLIMKPGSETTNFPFYVLTCWIGIVFIFILGHGIMLLVCLVKLLIKFVFPGMQPEKSVKPATERETKQRDVGNPGCCLA
ncbi:uncharacterized protein LOC143858651 [Tasmannia lanceolata]|uniref:uncharacterized protein LOC143858651 n=1 Tax=Tasmannia lanceolata TaxID=3420 RepID=UPI004062F6F0